MRAPSAQAQTSAGHWGPQEGWTRAQGVTDNLVLHLCALLWYLGSNLARGLLNTLWRNWTETLNHLPPKALLGRAQAEVPNFSLPSIAKNVEQILSVLSGRNSHKTEFPLPLAYWESLFPTAQSLGPQIPVLNKGKAILG